jgi:hypothetical protein
MSQSWKAPLQHSAFPAQRLFCRRRSVRIRKSPSVVRAIASDHVNGECWTMVLNRLDRRILYLVMQVFRTVCEYARDLLRTDPALHHTKIEVIKYYLQVSRKMLDLSNRPSLFAWQYFCFLRINYRVKVQSTRFSSLSHLRIGRPSDWDEPPCYMSVPWKKISQFLTYLYLDLKSVGQNVRKENAKTVSHIIKLFPKLQQLFMLNFSFIDFSACIMDESSLRTIFLENIQITDEVLLKFATHCHLLEELILLEGYLTRRRLYTDKGIQAINAQCRRIDALEIRAYEYTAPGPRDIFAADTAAATASLRRLSVDNPVAGFLSPDPRRPVRPSPELRVESTALDPAEVLAAAQRLPRLRRLLAKVAAGFSAGRLRALAAALPRLEWVHLVASAAVEEPPEQLFRRHSPSPASQVALRVVVREHGGPRTVTSQSMEPASARALVLNFSGRAGHGRAGVLRRIRPRWAPESTPSCRYLDAQATSRLGGF